MTGRIFRSICLVATGVLLASLVLVIGVFYGYYSDIQRGQLEDETLFAVQGYENEGLEFFDGLDKKLDVRITLIASDGKVIYDSDIDVSTMDNHIDREEIKEAIESGSGEASRNSATLMEKQLYFAKKVSDGNILRLSVKHISLVAVALGMLQPLLVIMFVAIICALSFALGLSKKIVEPLNKVDLDAPLKNEGYEEIAPLLRKIDAQQKKIRMQKAELSQRKKEFAAVTDKMSEGLILLGTGGNIISINRAASFLLGTENECEGENIVTVCRLPAVDNILHEAIAGKRAEHISELGGRVYKFSANPVFSDDEVSGVVLLILDVTESIDAEKMRREFTANVSHELKTPLQTISGCAELLANGIVKQEDVPHFSKQIHSEAQRMITLVQDIISLSHLDEGADDMQRTTIDLYAVCRDVVNELQSEAASADVSISLEGEKVCFDGIPQLISVIVNNLCDNAIKYNRAGGRVDVSVSKSEGYAILSVSDTGIGIPEADRERIFERFYRVDKSRSKKVGGTGLGLSIVKHAAKLHNATVTLESAGGVGTTVLIKFPI